MNGQDPLASVGGGYRRTQIITAQLSSFSKKPSLVSKPAHARCGPVRCTRWIEEEEAVMGSYLVSAELEY